MISPKIEDASLNRAAALYGLCDKVITLASGLLAITVTFRTSLLSAPNGSVRGSQLLVVAWIALAATVLCGLLTHYGAVDANTKAIRAMTRGETGVGIPSRFYRFTFWLMALGIMTALTAFVIFAILNTPE